jgi:hypothetical protein
MVDTNRQTQAKQGEDLKRSNLWHQELVVHFTNVKNEKRVWEEKEKRK